MKSKYELADVIKRFGSRLTAQTKLSPLEQKVLCKIAQCRTAALGGHEEVCENCGTLRYSYNSCGDRHCPKCQAAKQAFWIDDLMQNTLPIKHYHIVFTLPHQLNAVCLHNQRMYYDLLLQPYGIPCVLLATRIMVLKAVLWLSCTPGGRTFRCTLTFIALSRQQVIRSMADGKHRVIRQIPVSGASAQRYL